ncbi:unnamed protein product [Cylicocyclus nassatus]|uniref:Uncharacterized protein n=1 Tax=Cylicocyclus nassatus TaxID=53992 RepID=A0AA36GF61_CYLNA|nr:unnamed protein product [Cylicocyclus nassatus]
MKTTSAPSFAISSGWSTGHGEVKNVKSWDEIKYGRQPLILKKNVNGIEIYPCDGPYIRKSEQLKPVSLKAATAERTVLYPVKKMVCQQNLKYSPALGTNLDKRPSNDELLVEKPFRIKQHTTRPLTLVRPLGNVINLQAPDGSRAGTPLLQHSPTSSERSSSSSVPTCSSWDGSDRDIVPNQTLNSTPTSSYQTSDEYATVGQPMCERNPTAHNNGGEITASEQFVIPAVGVQNSSTDGSFDSQRDFMVTYHDLLGSPIRLPEHLSPSTERYLLDLDQQNFVSQGDNCGPETLQTACDSQVSDIDYSLFDEFFVRT